MAICAYRESARRNSQAYSKTTRREVLHRTLDVTDSAAVVAFVSAAEVRLCLVDTCVTNCGSPPSNTFRNTPPEARRAALDQF